VTTTNRERREAVIDALILHHHVSEDGDISFAGMADAAFAAALPDRAVFEAALIDLVHLAVGHGMTEAGSEEDRITRAAVKRDQAALIALVYGADDAQAGDQEGAEHE